VVHNPLGRSGRIAARKNLGTIKGMKVMEAKTRGIGHVAVTVTVAVQAVYPVRQGTLRNCGNRYYTQPL